MGPPRTVSGTAKNRLRDRQEPSQGLSITIGRGRRPPSKGPPRNLSGDAKKRPSGRQEASQELPRSSRSLSGG
eukprot:3696310-Pyramimonas_sp.AAC.1